MLCVHLCLFLTWVTTYVSPPTHTPPHPHRPPPLISPSELPLVFHVRFSGSDRVVGTEQGTGVIGNDRTGRSKYQSTARCSWGLWSRGSEAPRLLGFCQLIKAKSRPPPPPPPAGIRIKQPGEPFIPNWMPPLVTAEARQQATHGWQSLTQRSESQYPAEVAPLRHGEKVTGRKKGGSWKTRSRKPDDARRAVNVTVHFRPLCRFRCLTIKAKHIIFLAFPPITVKVTASVVNSCVQILRLLVHPPPRQRREDVLH